jgi:hypothetical protein
MTTFTKALVRSYWHAKFCAEISERFSIIYSKPHFSLLGIPHQLRTSCGPSTTAIRQATIQARMLSWGFTTDHRRRHWAHSDGSCTLPNCSHSPGNLLSGACHTLCPTQSKSLSQWESAPTPTPPLYQPPSLPFSTTPPPFLLDPRTNPHIIPLHQLADPAITDIFFSLTRTYIWSTYKKWLDLLSLSDFVII